MASTTEIMTLERFVAMLDAHGGDIERWPEVSRGPARRLLAGETRAHRLRAEAQALDRLLAMAPVTLPPPGMVDQIVARARLDRDRSFSVSDRQGVASTAASDGADVVIPMPTARAGRLATTAGDGAVGETAPRRHLFGGGGMLAASLLLGIWLGASGLATPSFTSVFPERQAKQTLDALSEIVQTALPIDLIDGTDEDIL